MFLKYRGKPLYCGEKVDLCVQKNEMRKTIGRIWWWIYHVKAKTIALSRKIKVRMDDQLFFVYKIVVFLFLFMENFINNM